MDPQKFDYNQDYNYNFGNNYGPGFNPNNNFYNKRSRNMEVAALVLSIIAIASCSCIYVSIICGSLAMIFALLSKGGATFNEQHGYDLILDCVCRCCYHSYYLYRFVCRHASRIWKHRGYIKGIPEPDRYRLQ